MSMPLPLEAQLDREKPETPPITPQEADEQSSVGHMPNPEAVTAESTLERTRKMGLYTEASAENTHPIDLAEEIAEQEAARIK